MKYSDIGSNETLLQYIEGCVNDFEANASTKQELMDNILGLSIYMAKVGGHSKRAEKCESEVWEQWLRKRIDIPEHQWQYFHLAFEDILEELREAKIKT